MRGLLVALALALASCVAPPPPAPKPAPPPKPTPATTAELRRLAEVFGTIRANYVTPVAESALAASCTSGMREYAASLRPPVDVPAVRFDDPLRQIAAVYGEAKQRRPGLDDRALVDACLTPMLANLDKLSTYYNREAFRELQVSSRGDFAAIGLELKIDGGFPAVVSAIEDTPASRSGIAAGDVILTIDGASTENLSLDQVVQRLRGKPQSTVVLTLRRAGSPEMRRELRREFIRVQTVISRTTPEGYTHIRLTQFQERTLASFGRALKAAHDQASGRPRIILDLRNSTGGLLYTAVGIPAAFLPETALVTEMKGRVPDSNRRLHAVAKDYLRGAEKEPYKDLPEAIRKAPLVVLVNSKTASGAEIVAAALQDHRRAQVIGEPTTGIGTIQTIFPTDASTAIKLTTAKFFRPRGEPVEGNPIVPDIPLSAADAALPSGTEIDVALAKARELLGKP